MLATTIKIEHPLLGKIKEVLPKGKSLSFFVREVLEQDIRRRKMIEAGEKYAHFLKSSTGEMEEVDAWEKADLVSPPTLSVSSTPTIKRKKS